MSLVPSFFGNNNRRSNILNPFSVEISDPLRPNFSRETSAFTGARIDWKETPEAHVFKADVPGLKKEDVKVEVKGGVLQISGERNKEQKEKNDTWHRIERSYGKFMRQFRLPQNAKLEQIKANIERGVLTVTVPKLESWIDWKETPEAHVFKAYAPGLKKEDVYVTVDDRGILQISGKFTGLYFLSENVKLNQIKANIANGVLTVTAPREVAEKPGVKSTDISG